MIHGLERASQMIWENTQPYYFLWPSQFTLVSQGHLWLGPKEASQSIQVRPTLLVHNKADNDKGSVKQIPHQLVSISPSGQSTTPVKKKKEKKPRTTQKCR
jgi:hypothetical protein